MGDERVLDLVGAVPPLVRVRRWIARVLSDLGEDHLTAVQLITTEVLTNAYDHAGGAGRVTLARTGPACRVRIEVDDGSLAPPILRAGKPTSVRGRGLVLVDNLAADWGYRLRGGGGKTVWALIDCSAYSWEPCA
ncbi:ATP-binding protein [Amycolatopsis endophytica]|uniref:Anti-sigma regulatory factor (Ser/Thr protein kinase) n=1 Tax=Amycolatopsis endophytica TaxID=860233 RepID=A0A853BFR0_9PSEU|nr:ATP-binding protein [Amycolatopsis endophytica]NYI93502.1 anti-sigma regulatory factor (Ser/Thr protein kinase) [Amycolatopsis endophytica]